MIGALRKVYMASIETELRESAKSVRQLAVPESKVQDKLELELYDVHAFWLNPDRWAGIDPFTQPMRFKPKRRATPVKGFKKKSTDKYLRPTNGRTKTQQMRLYNIYKRFRTGDNMYLQYDLLPELLKPNGYYNYKKCVKLFGHTHEVIYSNNDRQVFGLRKGPEDFTN